MLGSRDGTQINCNEISKDKIFYHNYSKDITFVQQLSLRFLSSFYKLLKRNELFYFIIYNIMKYIWICWFISLICCIVCLDVILLHRLNILNKFLLLFADFQTAFDKIPRDAMWKIIAGIEINEKLVNMIEQTRNHL